MPNGCCNFGTDPPSAARRSCGACLLEPAYSPQNLPRHWRRNFLNWKVEGTDSLKNRALGSKGFHYILSAFLHPSDLRTESNFDEVRQLPVQIASACKAPCRPLKTVRNHQPLNREGFFWCRESGCLATRPPFAVNAPNDAMRRRIQIPCSKVRFKTPCACFAPPAGKLCATPALHVHSPELPGAHARPWATISSLLFQRLMVLASHHQPPHDYRDGREANLGPAIT